MWRQIASDLLKKLANSANFFAESLHTTEHSQNVRKFKREMSEDKSTEYQINSKSLVFDVGGYVGQWTADVFARYQPRIYVFEPVPQFAKRIEHRFRKNPNIKVYDFGLSNKSTNSDIYLDQDGSSLFKSSAQPIKIKLQKGSDFIRKNKIKRIDLMKVNIEGAEYDLLEDLIETNTITLIDYLQVQFHLFAPDAKNRYHWIKSKLRKTHKQKYNYPFVWEAWSLK